MITGEIAILFASAAGIGAAVATWVYDRRLANRLTDLRRDVENLKGRIHGLDYRVFQTESAIVNLKRIESHLPADDVYERFVGRLHRSPAPTDPHLVVDWPPPSAGRPEGKSPDLAAPYTGCPDAKHPLYAKTGLPNQPVASLRPEAPTPCAKCGKPRVWTAGKLYGKDATLAHCETCQVAKTPKGDLVYCGGPIEPEPASQSLRPNWDCPTCSYRSYQPRAGNLRCPICKGLEVIE